MIDVVVLLIIIFFILFGLGIGFWQYLGKLLITAISLAGGWRYYQRNHEILKSLLIFVWLALCLTLLKWFWLSLKRKRGPQRPSLSLANKSWGAILGLFWGQFIAGLFLVAFELLPAETVFKYNIKEKVQASRASQIFHRLIPIKKWPTIENISYISKISLDERAKLKLQEEPQVQELLEHPSFKAVMEDPQTVSQLQNKDLPRLLTNPRILNLLNDGQFVEKLLKVDFKKAGEK